MRRVCICENVHFRFLYAATTSAIFQKNHTFPISNGNHREDAYNTISKIFTNFDSEKRFPDKKSLKKTRFSS